MMDAILRQINELAATLDTMDHTMTDLQAIPLSYYMPHALAVFQTLGAVWLIVFADFCVRAVCTSR
jgi:hypothetical protein